MVKDDTLAFLGAFPISSSEFQISNNDNRPQWATKEFQGGKISREYLKVFSLFIWSPVLLVVLPGGQISPDTVLSDPGTQEIPRHSGISKIRNFYFQNKTSDYVGTMPQTGCDCTEHFGS